MDAPEPFFALVGPDKSFSCTPLEITEHLSAGIPPAVIARSLGRPESWVRRHRELVAPGVHALFATGRLRSLAAHTGFRALPAKVRRRLLDAGGCITLARCTTARRAMRRRRGTRRPKGETS